MRTPTAALLHLTLTTLLVSLSVSTAAASPAVAEVPAAGACAGTSGVSVVVDLTDLGGEIVVGCAAGDPTTGRQALLDAGFVATDASSGLICAINSAPDPCPATFDGSYWAYWSAQPGADWTAYAVGADSSDPAPGTFEGWRYNDGTAAPGVLPAALEAAAPTATTTPVPAAAAAPVADDAGSDSGPSTATITGLGVAALLLVAAVGVVIARRRRVAASTSGETGETGD